MEALPYIRSVRLQRDKVPGFDHYPFDLPVVKKLDVLEFHPAVTFIVGENGSGKSTLIEALALIMGLNSEGGNRNTNFSTEDTNSGLGDYFKAIKSFMRPKDWYFLRAESFYNVATYMDRVATPGEQGYGEKSLHRQSHGESFMAVLVHKLRGRGLYLLDEPEAALSPMRQMAALVEIHRLVQAESQFIIATHSPILLSYPNAKILQIGDNGLEEVAYTDTEHYAVTRDFLNHYEIMLQELLE
jgi:predicted ATPase